jgi:hypothetical protein
MAAADPILGVTEAFVADTNPRKVNLGVGVYLDNSGKIPLLECVRHAESERLKSVPHRGYLPIDGLGAYDKAVQALVFGKEDKRIVTVQALGGTGGLRVGADLLKRISPDATVWISDPSWENHRQLFEAAGFTVKNYPYYDPKTHGLDFPGMRAALDGLPAGSIVVLHACCPQPDRVDLDQEQWQTVLEVVRSRGLVPFLDLAYQGFAESLEADGYAARLFAEAMSPVLLASSFSKSFSLYGERVGALSVVTASPEEGAARPLPAEAGGSRQLFQSADARQPGGGDHPEHAKSQGPLDPRTGRHARAHEGDAQAAGREDQVPRADRRLQLRAEAARHVLLLRPHQGAGPPLARGKFDLHHRYRPDLHRRAHHRQRRLRRRRDRQGHQLAGLG